jgi:S-adenosylmethionine synthetase
MPLALDLSHSLLWELAKIRKEEPDLMPYLRPDAKSQVTIEYDDNGKPLRIDTIVVSTQHDEFIGPKGISQKEADLFEFFRSMAEGTTCKEKTDFHRIFCPL